MEIFEWDENIPVTANNLNEMQNTLNDNMSDNFQSNGKIIWTNPNPTSAFAAQTITLSETSLNFDCYEILFSQAKFVSDPTSTANRLISTGKIPIAYGTILNYAVNNRYRLVNRPVGTSMEFLDGINGGTTDNEKCTPMYVIGYKTGLF